MNCLHAAKREAADYIVASLHGDPTGWSWYFPDTRVWIKHSSGIALGVYGGAAAVRKPAEMEFGWRDWFRIRRAYKRWLRRQGKAQAEACDRATCAAIVKALA